MKKSFMQHNLLLNYTFDKPLKNKKILINKEIIDMKKKQFKREGNSAYTIKWFENDDTIHKMREKYENKLKK